MRYLWKLAIVLGILLLIFLYKDSFRESLENLSIRRGVSADFSEHIMGIGYVINEEKWTEFSIPPNSNALRCILNGTIPTNSLPDEESIRYALLYQFVDQVGNQLHEGSYHFSSGLTILTSPNRKQVFTPNEYENKNIQALDRRKALFHLGDNSKVAFARFKLQKIDPRLKDVVIRVYTPLRVSPGKENVSWIRMSLSRKLKTARASILNFRYFEESEIVQLVRNQWKPVGPTGIKDEDYILRRIFSLQEEESENIDFEQKYQADGFLLGKNRHAMIPIPEGQGQLRIELKPMNPGAPDQVSFSYYQPQMLEPQQWLHRFEGPQWRFEQNAFEGNGLLELKATQTFVLKAWFNDIEITPEPAIVPTWRVLPNQPIIFDLENDVATPFRLTTYIQCGEEPQWPSQLPEMATYTYRALDQQDNIILQGTHQYHPEMAIYDFTDPSNFDAPIAKAEQRFLVLPKETRKLEIHSDDPLLVHGALRPTELPVRAQLPQDHLRYQDPETIRLPQWFLIDPFEKEELQRQRRTVTFSVQPKPPEPNPLLVSGTYVVEDYLSDQQQKGVTLMLPRHVDTGFQETSTKTAFVAIQPGLHQLNFQAEPSGLIAPTLFFQKGTTPQKIAVWVDGKPIREVTTTASQGEIRLVPMKAGPQQLEIRSETDIHYYINQLIPEADYLRRVFAISLDEEPMHFSIVKENSEKLLIVGNLYSPHLSGETITLSCVLEGLNRPQEAGDYTQEHREITITPSELPAVATLGSSGQRLDQGIPFFIPLEADLAPGTYHLKIKKLTGNEAYLRLTRIAAMNNEEPSVEAVPSVTFE